METRSIGKYEILTTLGRGSMGVVYKATDPEIDRTVAIKTLKTVYLGEDAIGNEALQRFKQESRSAGKLHHPNIVTIFEAGKTDDGSPFIVMEFIEGQSLGNKLVEQGSIKPVEVLHYMSQIASAIDYAHSKNVIHRDIKPNNIIIDSSYRPYLLDFGVAKLSDTSLTPAGTVVGTPSYMSPEQIRGETLDGRTDVFALAVLTYESLVGKRPFPGNDFTTVVGNILHKEPLSFAELAVDLPEELEQVLAKGLAKERDKRFSHALDFVVAAADALGIVVDGTGLPGGYSPTVEQNARLKSIAETRVSAPAQKPTAEPVSPSAETQAKPVVSLFDSPPPAPRRSNYFGPLLIGLSLGLVAMIATQKNLRDAIISQGRSIIGQGRDLLAANGINFGESTTAVVEVSPPPPPVMKTTPVVTPPTVTLPPAPLLSDLIAKAPADLSDDELVRVLTIDNPVEIKLREAIAEAGKRANLLFAKPLLALVAHSAYSVRVDMLKVISRPPYISSPETYPVLLRCLSDPEFIVRGFAVKVLVASAHPDTRTKLEERLTIEQNDVVRKIISEALSKVAPGGA